MTLFLLQFRNITGGRDVPFAELGTFAFDHPSNR